MINKHSIYKFNRLYPFLMLAGVLCGANLVKAENLTVSDCSRGNIQEGLVINQKIVRKDKRHIDAYVGLARCYQLMGKVGFTEKNVVKALELDPDHFEALLVMGDVHRYHKDWQAAKTIYAQAIKQNPKDSRAYYGLSQALMATGENKASDVTFKKARTIDRTKSSNIGSLPGGSGQPGKKGVVNNVADEEDRKGRKDKQNNR